jgi:hypothetical protein
MNSDVCLCEIRYCTMNLRKGKTKYICNIRFSLTFDNFFSSVATHRHVLLVNIISASFGLVANAPWNPSYSSMIHNLNKAA